MVSSKTRIGLAKWMEQRLHPNQIAENPVLEERLTPLKSLRMPQSVRFKIMNERLAHGLNENYGREIMELHTLGVKGGYTQADVIAVA